MFKKQTLVLFALALFSFSGCANKAPEAGKDRETPSSSDTAEARDFSPHPEELVGIWWGTATLNEDALATAIDNLSPLDQQKFIDAAKAFLSTEIAIEFKPDGSMETAMEIQNRSGKREPGVEFANWMASPMTFEREFRVQTTAKNEDGSQSTDQKIIRLSESGDQISFKVNVGGSLGRCAPQFILERQGVESVAREQKGQVR